jgi:phosphatidylglycerol lysyltransferase
MEERAIHAVSRKLDFLFSFRGLHHYKAKFATSWEPRYLIYSSVLQLPRTALALRRISEVRHESEQSCSSLQV